MFLNLSSPVNHILLNRKISFCKNNSHMNMNESGAKYETTKKNCYSKRQVFENKVSTLWIFCFYQQFSAIIIFCINLYIGEWGIYSISQVILRTSQQMRFFWHASDLIHFVSSRFWHYVGIKYFFCTCILILNYYH